MALAGGVSVGLGAGGVGATKTLAGGSALGSVASGVAAASGVGIGVKIALVVVAMAAVGGALVQLTPSRETAAGETSAEELAARSPEVDRAIDSAPSEAVSELAPGELAPAELAAGELAPMALAIDPESVPSSSGPSARRSPREAATAHAVEVPSAPVGSTLMEEMALLSPARAALARRDTGAARELVGRYRTRYPGGAFAEEFAAIEVEALCLERSPSAAASRDSFERAHPGSNYATRLARACD